MTEQTQIVIIGAGKLGNALHQSLQRLGQFQTALVGRDHPQHIEAIRRAEIVLLTVQDDVIQSVCQQHAADIRSGAVIAHCSGVLTSDVLRSAKQCHIASAHPLNTFPSEQEAITLLANPQHGTHLYLEGDEPAKKALDALFKALNFEVHQLSAEAKTKYHIACVFACNYLTALIEMSLGSAEQAGIERAQFWRSIQPLIRTTLTNIDLQGTTTALSGPIARGDRQTVERHLDALTNMRQAYQTLGQQALELARCQGKLSSEQIAELEELLHEP